MPATLYKGAMMKALVLQEYNKLVVEDVPIPEYARHEVLVRVRSVGICGSDVHGFDGTSGRRIPPVIMGHEIAGEIAELGSDVKGWKTGDRVTFDSTIYPLDDWFSRRGQYNLSDGRTVLGVSCGEFRRDGGFAEYVVIPAYMLYRIPDEVSFDQAAMTEPLSVALHAVAITPVELGSVAVVIGGGVIGLFIASVLGSSSGCAEVIISDIQESRRELARRLGFTHVVDPTRQDLRRSCEELTAGRGADAAFEAVGIEATISQAIEIVRKGATVTLVGNLTSRAEFPLQRVVSGEIRLQGSCAICGEYPAALALIKNREIDLTPFISRTAPLEEAPELFDRLHSGDPDLVKVILHP